MNPINNLCFILGREPLSALAFGLAASGCVFAGSDDSHYYVNDHLATTVGIADAAGDIAALEADAFGLPLSATESVSRFTGKPYDADLGAYVFPFRNYRADEARWMSADPSGFPDGTNRSAYLANALRAVDPLGLVVVVHGNTTAYDQAKAYATSTSIGQALWSQLESSSQTYNIDVVTGMDSKFNWGNGTNGGQIIWNPEQGAKDSAGNAISPATSLLHEMAHAAGYDSDYNGFKQRKQDPNIDPVWGDPEERRVIQDIENPFAVLKGEGQRTSHNGSVFKARSVTSNLE